MPFTNTISSFETCGAKTVLLQMLVLGVKALLWKTATLATDNVKRTELDGARCKWRVGTV
jgi:hypothetical protein